MLNNKQTQALKNALNENKDRYLTAENCADSAWISDIEEVIGNYTIGEMVSDCDIDLYSKSKTGSAGPGESEQDDAINDLLLLCQRFVSSLISSNQGHLVDCFDGAILHIEQ